jgi:hypothetical protein
MLYLSANRNEVVLSEYIQEKNIQRIVAGREGGNVLTITNLDDEVRFSIKASDSSGIALSVSLTLSGFSNLLGKLLEIETGTMASTPIKSVMTLLPKSKSDLPKKSALPENIDDMSAGRKKPESKPKNVKRKTVVPQRGWTDEEEEELVQMIRAGMSDKQIAEKTGRTNASIRNRRHYPTIKSILLGQSKKGSETQFKSGSWSEAETAELARRVVAGQTDVEISEVMKRSYVSVRDKRRSREAQKLILEQSSKQQALELAAEEDDGSAS